MNILLYMITVAVWGGSWLAIKWQLGPVPVPLSIFYRFALAAFILMSALSLLGKLEKTGRQDHLYFLLQGVSLFSLNFIAFYTASGYIVSGLVAVVMSTITIFNAFHNKLFWGKKPATGFKLGVLSGIAGLVLLFWAELSASQLSLDTLMGVAFSLLGTWLFSLGNMVSLRHSRRGITPTTSTAWAMCYGCGVLLLIFLLSGEPVVIPSESRYLGALLYLSLFASVLGFSVYLMLVARIGPNSAAYALVATPVVALVISCVFEGYQWTNQGLFGLVFILLGNVIVLGNIRICGLRFLRILRQ